MRGIAAAILIGLLSVALAVVVVERWSIAPLSVETNTRDTETIARFLRLDRWTGEVQFCRHTVPETQPNPRTTCSAAEPAMRRPS
ncbi:hypothetical protein ACLBXJ_26845 [Methylobacterium mesophilicum]